MKRNTLSKLDEAYKNADALINSEIAKLQGEDATIKQSITDLDTAMQKADKALDDAIKAVQKNLDDAKAALEASDAANKSDLNAKIAEADATLQGAINALATELDSVKQALDEKDDELQTFVIIVCVISGVAFCGCGALAVFFIIDKKKRI